MKPYSQDFREAAVRAYLNGPGSYAQVARLFNIHEKSLQGWVKMARRGEPQRPRGKGHKPRSLSPADLDLIVKTIEANPSITLGELKKIVGVAAHETVYWRAVRGLGYTYKKKELWLKNKKGRT